MSRNRYTDLVCVLITVLTLVVTVVFMNGAQFGLVKAESDAAADRDGIFSDRDLAGTWSENSAVRISLDDMEGLTDSGAYELDGDLYIIAKGTYVLSGSLTDHQVIVDAKDSKVQLVLDGITVENEELAPIYVKKADKVFLTLAEGSTNTVSVETLLDDGEDLPDAAVYSKSDLTINGDGTLQVSAGGGHGIKTTDDLVITGGVLVVEADENALQGKDSVRIYDGDFTLTAGKDGIKANNDTNEEKGYVTIVNGTFSITAVNDGIQAETDLVIEDGVYTITTNGGADNGAAHMEEFGGMGGMGGFGGFGGFGTSGDDENGGFRHMGGGRGKFDRSEEETDEMSETGEMPDISGIPEIGERPDFGEMPDFGEIPNVSEMPEMGEMPDISEMPEMGEMPDISGMPEMGEIPDISEMPEMNGEMPEQAQNAGAEEASGEAAADGETTDAETGETVSDSHKGIKAGRSITISGGSFELDCSDDAIHSDGDVTITAGDIQLSTGDDGIHADDLVDISGGTITILQSYEGIEGETIEVSDGVISVTSSDDGFNASGGSTDSMFGFGMGNGFGSRGDFRWQTGEESTEDTEEETAETELPLLHITGGTIYVFADGDGLDSNGDLVIDGGEIYVNGPTNSGNGALDSGSESGGDIVINGGTIIALGASGMDETFTENSTQYSFRVTVNESFQEGDLLTITDSEGHEIFRYTVQKTGNSVVFSSPELQEGETYTVTVGDQTAEITLDGVSGGGSSGGFGMQMRR